MLIRYTTFQYNILHGFKASFDFVTFFVIHHKYWRHHHISTFSVYSFHSPVSTFLLPIYSCLYHHCVSTIRPTVPPEESCHLLSQAPASGSAFCRLLPLCCSSSVGLTHSCWRPPWAAESKKFQRGISLSKLPTPVLQFYLLPKFQLGPPILKGVPWTNF